MLISIVHWLGSYSFSSGSKFWCVQICSLLEDDNLKVLNLVPEKDDTAVH